MPISEFCPLGNVPPENQIVRTTTASGTNLCLETIMSSSTSRDVTDVFALSGELSRAILTSTGANEGNRALDRVALVGRLWHNALAPQAGACMPALTRRVTLAEPDMPTAQIHVRLRGHGGGWYENDRMAESSY